jgi:hypothetical protein
MEVTLLHGPLGICFDLGNFDLVRRATPRSIFPDRVLDDFRNRLPQRGN